MLEVTGVDAGYNKNTIIQNINICVPKKEIVSIIGVNGAGKTTLMRVICGLITPKNGKVIWEGQDVTKLPPEKRVPLGIVYCPEGRGIFSELTVAENLMVATYSRKSKQDIRNDQETVLALFPRLKERWHQVAGTLSGGEQQMLAVGRSLMSKPKILLLDEPSMGLAPLVVKEIFEKIEEIRQSGTSIVLVEQNANIALGLSDKVYVFGHGKIVKEGTPEEIKSDGDLQEIYLGKIH